MTVSLQDLQRFVRNCDPTEALPADHPFYCALDEGTPVRGSIGQSCIDDLYTTIILDDHGATQQLFTGFPGSGKTTELLRLVKRLEGAADQPTHVLYVDVERDYLNAYSPIEPADLLRILAYVLDREALRVEGKDPDQSPGYVQRLVEYFRDTQIDLKSVQVERGGVRLMAELRTEGPLRRTLSEALAKRFQAFAAEAQAIAAEAVERIKRAAHVERVVLIIDGLEKIRPAREDDRARIESSVEQTFIESADQLKLSCHVVLTFPMWLRFRTPWMGSLFSAEPSVLPMVKLKDPDGVHFQPGITKLAELVGRRIDVARVFGTPSQQLGTLVPLLLASGGYPRDLLRLLRAVLRRAGGVFPVTEKVVEQVISRLAEEYRLGLRDEHFSVLKEVAKTHVFPRGDDQRVNLFGRLLDHWYLLAYRNGVPEVPEWYDLHPLIARAKVVREAFREE